MQLPNYIKMVCDLSGVVLEKPDGIDIKTIFEIVNEQSLPRFHEYVKDIFENGKYVQVHKVQLIDNKQYFLNLEIMIDKIICYFKLCDDIHPEDEFWIQTATKFDYYLDRCKSITTSVCTLISSFFEKKRSNIQDIIKQLSSTFKLEKCMVLFRNGHDHCVYCQDVVYGYKCDYLEDQETIHFEDDKYLEDNIMIITDLMRMKLYKDTYFKNIFDDKNMDDRKVYVLKLVFGGKTIGFFEFIPHKHITLAPIEINIMQSLSTILAYIINNKNETTDIEKYIIQKLSQKDKK